MTRWANCRLDSARHAVVLRGRTRGRGKQMEEQARMERTKTKRRDGEARNRGSAEWMLRGNCLERSREEVEGASRSRSVCAELPCFRFSCQALSLTSRQSPPSSCQASRLWNSSTASCRIIDRCNDIVVCLASCDNGAEAEWEHPKQSQASAPYLVCDVDYHILSKHLEQKLNLFLRQVRHSPARKCASSSVACCWEWHVIDPLFQCGAPDPLWNTKSWVTLVYY